MLISEEEIPFKDDPRDETYKPHLERHVSDFTLNVSVRKRKALVHAFISPCCQNNRIQLTFFIKVL